jgi:hypothetical protein
VIEDVLLLAEYSDNMSGKVKSYTCHCEFNGEL